MRIQFDSERKLLVFIHESPAEQERLSKFPAFERRGLYYVVQAVLPVAYNVVTRWKHKWPKTIVSPEVSQWLDSQFELRKLPDTFKYHTTPKDFQDIALRYMYSLDSSGLLLEPGMGKSKVVLDYIFLMGFKKVIIVCPSPLLFVWEDEIEIHRPELTKYVVKSTNWEAEKEEARKAQVVIINYNKVVILKHRLKEEKYEFIHLDEFLIKDPTTDRTNSTTELAAGIPHRCGGSGTLVNNSPLDIFAPVRYLYPSLVGGNFTAFKNRYAVLKEAKKFDPKDRTRIVVVGFRDQPEIRSILESCCIVMTKQEWLHLPPKYFHEVQVEMGEEQSQTYYDLMRNYYAQVQGVSVEIDNPLVMLSKLYQVSQGFLYSYPDSEDEISAELFAQPLKKKKVVRKISERTTTFFKEQPKVEALKGLLTGELQGKKTIIWFNLEGEFRLIEDLLNSLGAKFLTIKGGDKKIGEKVKEFNKTPDMSYLLCQAKAVNYGITVLGRKAEDLDEDEVQAFPGVDPSVHTQVFYSRNFSQEVLLQQQDRIHRLGQTQDCHYYFLMSNSPVEKKIKNSLELKKAIRSFMLKDIALSLLRGDEKVEEVAEETSDELGF